MTNKNQKVNESGRSMVEMLGVLAIIGVLSIGGIMGYNRAITKYRTNELLAESSKRAMIISNQIEFDNQIPDSSGFSSQSFGHAAFESTIYGPDGESQWTTSDEQFVISITGVEEKVCEEMKRSIGHYVQDFQPSFCAPGRNNNIKLTYNNDLSFGTRSSED